MNKNKQNKLSFADLARKIKSKYQRAEYDPLEKADMELELENLMLEQETMRTQLGLNQQNQPVQQFAYGGKMYPDGGTINSWEDYIGGMPNIYDRILNPPAQEVPSDDVSTDAVKEYLGNLPNIYDRALNKPVQMIPNSIGNSSKLVSTPGKELLYNPTVSKYTTKPTTTTRTNKSTSDKITQPIVNQPIDYSRNESRFERGDFTPSKINGIKPNVTSLNTNSLDKMDTLTPEQRAALEKQGKTNLGLRGFIDKNKQYAPYAIAGASNIASNLLLANMAKKNQQKVNPILSTPEKMNMEAIAEKLRKDAGVSKNIGMKNARDLGTNAGSSLANMGVMGSAVDRQLGDNLTSLYGQQEQYNVGTANQFALQNQDAGNRANMINAQLGQQANQDQLGYLSGALGTIPGVMKDIRMDKADSQMRDVMDRYYQSVGGRNYATVGSIFKDPKSGFKYKVKPDLTLEQVKE